MKLQWSSNNLNQIKQCEPTNNSSVTCNVLKASGCPKFEELAERICNFPKGEHGIGQDESEYLRMAEIILNEPDAFENVGDDVFYWFTLLTPTIGDVEHGSISNYANWIQEVRKLEGDLDYKLLDIRKSTKVSPRFNFSWCTGVCLVGPI